MEISHSLIATLIEGLWLFLCLGLSASLLYGLLLLILPSMALALAGRLNHWVSLRRGFKPLERPRPQDGRLYRHHRAVGALLFLGGLYILYILNYHFEPDAFTQALSHELPESIASWLADSLTLLLYLFALVGLPLGPVVYLRPSLLKGMETQANRWISSRRGLRFLELSYSPLEGHVKRHPRSLGLFIATLCLYLLLLLLPLGKGLTHYLG